MTLHVLHDKKLLVPDQDVAIEAAGEFQQMLQELEADDLASLTPMEQQLYDALRNNSFSNNLRQEQERVGFTWLLNALRQRC